MDFIRSAYEAGLARDVLTSKIYREKRKASDLDLAIMTKKPLDVVRRADLKDHTSEPAQDSNRKRADAAQIASALLGISKIIIFPNPGG